MGPPTRSHVLAYGKIASAVGASLELPATIIE
jgi:hypothetical protein